MWNNIGHTRTTDHLSSFTTVVACNSILEAKRLWFTIVLTLELSTIQSKSRRSWQVCLSCFRPYRMPLSAHFSCCRIRFRRKGRIWPTRLSTPAISILYIERYEWTTIHSVEPPLSSFQFPACAHSHGWCSALERNFYLRMTSKMSVRHRRAWFFEPGIWICVRCVLWNMSCGWFTTVFCSFPLSYCSLPLWRLIYIL